MTATDPESKLPTSGKGVGNGLLVANRPLTVTELQKLAVATLHLDEDFTATFFGRWTPGTWCGGQWLLSLNNHWEEIRQETVRGAGRSNLLQCDFNRLGEFIARKSRTVLVSELAPLPISQRLPRLIALVGFSLSKPELSLQVVVDPSDPERTIRQLWTCRDQVLALERRLDLTGYLLDPTPPPGELNFALEPTFADAELAFARELRRARKEQKKTLRAVSSQVDLTLQRLQDFEQGRKLPGHGSWAKVVTLAAVLKPSHLLSAFKTSRDFWDKTRPGARCKDLKYGTYVSEKHHVQLEALLAWEDGRTGVTRGGHRYSGGRLAASSRIKFKQFFSQFLTFLQLPQKGSGPRTSGLGLAADDTSLLDAGDPEFLEHMLDWFHLRCGRSTFAKSEAAFLGKIADYFRPHNGYFYVCAQRLAQTLPAASIERCPTVWPAGSDCAETECRPGAERIRARCHEIHAFVRPLHLQALNAAPSPDRLQDVTETMDRCPHLLDALVTILCRSKRIAPRNTAEALEMQDRAIFAFACYRPLRIGDFGAMKLVDVIVGTSGQIKVFFCPKKNHGSQRARERRYEPMPPEVAQYLADYLAYARPLLCPAPDSPELFFNETGESLTDYYVRNHLARLVAKYGSDLFPRGLRVHRVRSIVATDLTDRFGLDSGSYLAADALVVCPTTVKRNYVLRAPVPAKFQAGPRTQEAAIRAAFLAVTGRRFRPSRPLRR